MILDVEQISKDFFAAEFVIKRDNAEVGRAFLKGHLGSIEAKIKGNYYGRVFYMDFSKAAGFKSKKCFRPYFITDDYCKEGVIYQAERKLGLFKGYSYREMRYCNDIYEMYSLGLGKEGYKSPIYLGDRQIAQIDMDCVVKNQLFKYKIYAIDNSFARIAVLFCLYFYVSGVYSSGEKVISSETKYYTVTKNKALLEKYDKEFVKTILHN